MNLEEGVSHFSKGVRTGFTEEMIFDLILKDEKQLPEGEKRKTGKPEAKG